MRARQTNIHPLIFTRLIPSKSQILWPRLSHPWNKETEYIPRILRHWLRRTCIAYILQYLQPRHTIPYQQSAIYCESWIEILWIKRKMLSIEAMVETSLTRKQYFNIVTHPRAEPEREKIGVVSCQFNIEYRYSYQKSSITNSRALQSLRDAIKNTILQMECVLYCIIAYHMFDFLTLSTLTWQHYVLVIWWGIARPYATKSFQKLELKT